MTIRGVTETNQTVTKGRLVMKQCSFAILLFTKSLVSIRAVIKALDHSEHFQVNGFSHALTDHLCNNCTCKVVSEVYLDIRSSLWKHKSISQYFNTNLKMPVYTSKKLLQTAEEKKCIL